MANLLTLSGNSKFNMPIARKLGTRVGSLRFLGKISAHLITHRLIKALGEREIMNAWNPWTGFSIDPSARNDP